MREGINNNVLAGIAAIILLGLSISGNHQLFAEDLRQPPNVTNQTTIIKKCSINPMINESDSKKMSTTILGHPRGGSFPSMTQRIINELGNDTSDEIATYPINALEPDVLLNVLCGLSVDNLYKVLVNLPHDHLKTLLVDNLTSEQSKQILDRLPQDKKVDIQNRSNF